VPPLPHRAFRSFWASGTGWGEFSYTPGTSGGHSFALRVHAGTQRCRSITISGHGSRTKLRIGDKEYPHSAKTSGNTTQFTTQQTIVIAEGEELRIEVGA
jgi:hypothetical protein